MMFFLCANFVYKSLQKNNNYLNNIHMKNYLILFLFFLMGVETIDAQTAVKLYVVCRNESPTGDHQRDEEIVAPRQHPPRGRDTGSAGGPPASETPPNFPQGEEWKQEASGMILSCSVISADHTSCFFFHASCLLPLFSSRYDAYILFFS